MEDEQIVESTTASSSDENNQTEETSDASESVITPEVEPVKEEGKVPYSRFKDVNDKYKELLAAQTQKIAPQTVTSQQVRDVESSTGENYEDALKIIDNRAESIVSRKLEAVQRQMDLDRTIQTNPDFLNYADAIKSKIQDNPHLSWSDAYKLAKYDTSLVQAKELGKQEAYKKIEQKKAASVETASKSRVVTAGSSEIDPLAKGPDGKFLYSIKELKDILPNK